MTEAKTFAELSISELLKNNLRRAGFVNTTPVQGKALIPALEGRDILATAKTGSGKTLAFILPIVERLAKGQSRGIDPVKSQPRRDVGAAALPTAQRTSNGVEALILAPTRELASQIMDTLKIIGAGTGIPVALVVGGLSESKQLSAIRHGARIVIATPGRLNDYLNRRLLSLNSVKILVLDEADRMVDMGFLPQMRLIMNHVPKDRQSMCFSATLGREVSHLVRDYLKNPLRIEVDPMSRPAESVFLKMYEVPKEKKLFLLIHMLQNEPGTFLVFTRTKYEADKLTRKLVANGFDAAVLHGGKSQSQRTRALGGFKEGKHRVLIATDIAARGIHVDKIGHVINYNLPQSSDDFIHRVGRTGRVEESGVAVTFVTHEDAREIYQIERQLGKKIQRLPLPEGLASEPKVSPTPFQRPRPQARHGFGQSRSDWQKPSGGQRNFRRRGRY